MKTMKKPWTNTHFYDNNISINLKSSIQALIQSNSSIPEEDKLDTFNTVRNQLIGVNSGPKSLHYFDKMVSDFKSDNKNNWDPINELDAADLLFLVCHNITRDTKHLDITLLSEQLNDMKTGFCPQGRTIRLVQIISFLI